MKIGILTSFVGDYKNYIKACEAMGVDYEVIDIFDAGWLELVKKSKCDGFMVRPPCDSEERKYCFDERVYSIVTHLQKKIYPSMGEISIYENKRNLHYWLKINGYKHADTNVSLTKDEAIKYISSCEYPIIAKSNIGAMASGVVKINNISQAKRYVNSIFGYFDGKLAIGKMPVTRKFKFKIPMIGRAQKHYAIFQECLDVKWEWRIIRINNSYFGYRKLLGSDGFASGNHLDGWGNPPEELLYLVKEMCDKGSFYSMAVDFLETNDGQFYVNEMQTCFGASNPSQMYIDDKPCRYLWNGNEFELEYGYFCENGCSNLRVEHFVELLKV
tara:strand:- start:2478 stop:3464 length:987 start_codon:yes stop_codon:yes gene_type:complete